MNLMFNGCSSLKKIDLYNFHISDDTSMNCMFYGCSEELQNQALEQIKNIKEEAF